MGGNAFPNENISRLDLEQYYICVNNILSLSNRFHKIEILPEKESFGDIDIIYAFDDNTPTLSENISDIFRILKEFVVPCNVVTIGMFIPSSLSIVSFIYMKVISINLIFLL